MEHLDGYCGPEPTRIIRDVLKRRSLDAPGGFPVYRLVHSEFVFERIGGQWSDWNEGIAYADRGSISNVLDADGLPTASSTPIRTVVEIRTVPTYCSLDIQGWVLERWFPAHKFGSPEWHYSQVVPGTSIPRLGPYPDRGKYVMLTGPFEQEPSIDFLQDFISAHQQRAEAILDQDIDAYVKQRVYDAEKAEEKRRKKVIEENFLRIMEGSKNILFGTSLAAGRLRNAAAEKMGIRSHMGN